MKTAYRKNKEARELALYNEYQKLSGQPESMKTAIEQALMKKYKIHSRSTIWAIIQRVEKRSSPGLKLMQA